MKTRQPDDHGDETKKAENTEMSALEASVHDFMDAMNRNDIHAMAKVIKDAHEILHAYMDEDTESEEESNPEPHSFEAQNQLAAKEDR